MVSQKEENIDHEQEGTVMDRIIRVKEVLLFTGLSRSSLWRSRAAGDFPPPIQLSPGIIGWRVSSIEKWLESKEEATAAKSDEPV